MGETEREIDSLKEELSTARRKAMVEASQRARLQEQLEDALSRLREVQARVKERDDEAERRAEELVFARRQAEAAQVEASTSRAGEERTYERLRECEAEALRLGQENAGLQRRFTEQAERASSFAHDNETLRFQLVSAQSQLKLAQGEADALRAELAQARLLAAGKERQELTWLAQVERSTSELNQLRLLLSRAEQSNEALRRQNDELLGSVTRLASQTNGAQENFDMMRQRKSSFGDEQHHIRRLHQEPSLPTLGANFGGVSEGNSLRRSPKMVERPPMIEPSRQLNNDVRPPPRGERLQTQQQYSAGDFLRWEEPQPPAKVPEPILKTEPNLTQNVPRSRQINNIPPPRSQDYHQKENQDLSSPLTRRAELKQTSSPPQVKVEAPRENAADRATIKTLEGNLMTLNLDRTRIEAELAKLDEQRTKTAASLRRRRELEGELSLIGSNINLVKTRLKELNAWNPY
eukprot:TRINITY_DN10687_c0_g1_i4.p1 TRINITY_DN10687_c0_g1~~TRINITY_DN10687_c0_g1_i4.p1  ORF type:complete len:465 (-),score=122.88 TRINITY_DN10687_c0_g1_i4:182-1576(-)